MDLQVSGESEAIIAKLLGSADYATPQAIVEIALRQLDVAFEHYWANVRAAVARVAVWPGRFE